MVFEATQIVFFTGVEDSKPDTNLEDAHPIQFYSNYCLTGSTERNIFR